MTRENIRLKAIIKAQSEQIIALETLNAKLMLRIEELERRLALNSHNSSKPPSSDGLRKPFPRSLREKSGKPSGGQKGHKGDTLKQVATPDFVMTHKVSVCSHCASHLEDKPLIDSTRRQVFDIPDPRILVTEHQAESKFCPTCGKIVTAPFPKEVSAQAQYGVRIKALSVYLHQQQMIPEDRLAVLFKDVFGLSISATSIANYSVAFAEQVKPITAVILDHLRHAEVKHLDESGLRVNGKLQWLHVLSNAEGTNYRVSERRGELPKNLSGCVMHDHFKPYYKLTDLTHAVCGAHYLRELKALAEIEKEPWAIGMFTLLQNACHQVNQEGGISQLDAEGIGNIYDELVLKGLAHHEQQKPLEKGKRGMQKRRIGHNLALRFQNYREDSLRFLFNKEVPFTNNQAEQDIRMIKVKQKISGGFRTPTGAEIFATTRSYLSTMRKQSINLFQSILHPSIPFSNNF